MPLSAVDIAEILNLAPAHNHAVDAPDPDARTDAYAEDVLVSPFGDPNGRAALREWISGVTGSLSGTRHCTINEVVAGDGDRATMRSSDFVVATKDTPPTIRATGGDDDELIRVGGRWRFARRVHTVDASFGGESLAG